MKDHRLQHTCPTFPRERETTTRGRTTVVYDRPLRIGIIPTLAAFRKGKVIQVDERMCLPVTRQVSKEARYGIPVENSTTRFDLRGPRPVLAIPTDQVVEPL